MFYNFFKKSKAIIDKYPRLSVLAVCFSVVCFMFFSSYHVTLVRYKSVKYSFTIWSDDIDSYRPERNDYILMKWPNALQEEVGLKEGDILIKRIGCVEGDTLEFNPHNNYFMCNGTYLGMGLEEMPNSKQKLSLFTFGEKMVVPKGMFFAVGDNPTSYDSKYFGFVDICDIMGKVVLGI